MVYVIVSAETIEGLRLKVQILLDAGWALIGGPFFSMDSKLVGTFNQALTKQPNTP